jgi:periplasmic protein TonB
VYSSSLNPSRPSQVTIFVLLLILHVGGLAWVSAASHRTPPPETERLLVSIIEAPQLVPAVQAPEPPPVIKPPPRPPEPVREVRHPDPPPPQPIAPREMQPPPPPVKVEPVPVPKPVPQPEPERVAVVAEPVIAAPPAPEAAPAPVQTEPAPVQQAVAPPRPSTPPPPPVVPIVEARYDAAYLDNPKPSYPVMARRQGLQGRVLLRVLVSAAGRPEKVELKQTSGSNALDRSALDAVSQWRFVPARQGEKAVDAWIVVPIIFTLKG